MPSLLQPLLRLARQHLFVLPALALILGICVGDYFFDVLKNATSGLFLACIATLIAAFFCIRYTVHLKHFYLGAFLLVVGLVGAILQIESIKKGDVNWCSGVKSWYATVVDTPKNGKKTWLLRVKLTYGDFIGQKVQLRLMKQDSAQLHVGDKIMFRAKISKPRNSLNPNAFAYGSWLKRQGVSGEAFSYAGQWKIVEETRLPLTLRLLRQRDEFVAHFRSYFQGRDLAVLAALTLGDKSMLNQTTRSLFSATGASHLLALSGLHLSILFFFFTIFGTFFQKKQMKVGYTLLAIPLLWAFTFLAGAPLSLVRAALMLSVFTLSSLLQRNPHSLDNLALAAVVILLVSPQALFDVGFQLSFLAVLGIQLFKPLFPRLKWCQKSKIVASFFDFFVLSTCAQLTTLPLVAYYFNVLPTYALLVSSVIVPLAYPLLFFSLLLLLLPFGAPLWTWCIGISLDALFGILETASSWPLARLSVYPTLFTVGISYCALLLLYIWLQNRRVLLLYAMSACFVLGGGVALYRHQTRGLPVQIIFYESFSGANVHCIESSEKSYLWTLQGDNGVQLLYPVAARFWEREKICRPSVLRSDTSTSTLHYSPHLLAFFHKRIALVYEKLPRSYKASPLHVNYLYLISGYKQPLADALRIFTPDMIVLDTGLSSFYLQRYKTEAQQLGLRVHNMAEQGALIVTLS